METKYKNLLKDTGIFALGSFGSKLLLFLLVPIYTNFLSTEEYGTAELIFTITNLVLPFLTLTIHESVLRFGIAKEEKRENVFLIGVLIWGASCILSFFLTFLSGLYEPIKNWKWYLFLSVITSGATTIELNYLKVKNKNKLYAIISIIQTAILASSNIIFLVYLRTGVKGYLLSTIIAHIFVMIAAFIFGDFATDLLHAKFSKTLLKKMAVFSSPLILNNVSWWMINSSNKIMIESIIGASALGLYTVSSKIPSLINVIISIFIQAWGISSIKEVESSNENSFFINVFKLYNFIVCGASIFFVTIIKPFMAIYVGDEFQSAWQYIPLLLVGASFYAISSYFGSLYSALKKTVNNMVTTLISAVVNVAVSLVCIHMFGIWGAVLGTTISYVLIANMRMLDIRRYMKLDIPWRVYLINSILIILHAVAVSFDWHIYLISLIIIICFIINNLSQIKFLLTNLKQLTKTKLGKK